MIELQNCIENAVSPVAGEVKLSITRSRVQNLSLPDERSNREISRRIGFYSVYLVSLQGLLFIPLYFHIYRLTSAPLISLLIKSGLPLPTHAN